MEVQRLSPLTSIQDMLEGLFKLQSFVLDQFRPLLQLYHSSTLLPSPASQVHTDIWLEVNVPEPALKWVPHFIAKFGRKPKEKKLH